MARTTTVYSFAKRLMDDKEFNCGGIIENERKYLDAIGFDYIKDEYGQVSESGDDLCKFYEAMRIIWELQRKYSAKQKGR